MASYQVPPDMKEKEKIIGGMLTLNQGAWLVLGFVVGGFTALALFKLVGVFFSLFLGVLIAVAIGVPFAFYKKNELTFFRYLYLKNKFLKQEKFLPNRK